MLIKSSGLREKEFSFIQFTAGDYYHDNEHPSLANRKNSQAFDALKIPLGQSRYDGPIADLPVDFNVPTDMQFLAQLDLAFFSDYDPYDLLPKQGQLVFFWQQDNWNNNKQTYPNHVYYFDVPNHLLVRTAVSYENGGVLIEKAFVNTETLADRYIIDDEYELEHFKGDEEWCFNGKVWDSFEGQQVSKIFGIPTHSQKDPNHIAEEAFSENIVLLQIGEGDEWNYETDENLGGGFNTDGLLSVTINKEALIRRDFSNCQIDWGGT